MNTVLYALIVCVCAVDAQGGSVACSSFGGPGSGGRIAVHASMYAFAGTMSACGGSSLSTFLAGGPGTVYINDVSALNRSLLVSGV